MYVTVYSSSLGDQELLAITFHISTVQFSNTLGIPELEILLDALIEVKI